MTKIAPAKAASCPAPAAAAADQPRAVEPPAVTVAPAVKREFVDRLFVSGTLVAREEAQVAARIDGLTIVEVDAEDGDRVTEGQVLARLDRTPARRASGRERRGDQARRCGDRPGAEPDRAVARRSLQFANDDFERARKLGERRDGGLDHRAARDRDEDRRRPSSPRPGTRSASPRPIARAATPSGRSSWCASTGRRSRRPSRASSAGARPGSAPTP